MDVRVRVRQTHLRGMTSNPRKNVVRAGSGAGAEMGDMFRAKEEATIIK